MGHEFHGRNHLYTLLSSPEGRRKKSVEVKGDTPFDPRPMRSRFGVSARVKGDTPLGPRPMRSLRGPLARVGGHPLRPPSNAVPPGGLLARLPVRPQASYQVHHQARRHRYPCTLSPPATKHPSRELPGEEGSHQRRDGFHLPPHPRQDTQNNDQADRQMYRQKPLGGESPHVGPPVAEGQVHDQDYEGCFEEVHGLDMSGKPAAIQRPPPVGDGYDPHRVVLATIYHSVAANHDLPVVEFGQLWHNSSTSRE